MPIGWQFGLVVGVDSGSLYRQTRSISCLAWSEGRRPLGAIIHQMNRVISRNGCHDDSTINIVLELLLLLLLGTYMQSVSFPMTLNVMNDI